MGKVFGYQCPICKTTNPESTNYCLKCGNWLLDTTNPAKRVEFGGGGKLKIFLLGIAAGVVLLVALAVVSAPSINKTNSVQVQSSASTLNTGAAQQATEQQGAEEKAAAETVAANKAAADKAAAEKAAYLKQFSWYNGEFGVINDSGTADEFGLITIKGRAIAFNKDYSYVQITYGIYSTDGSKVGAASTNISHLAKGTTWRFSATGNTGSSGKFKYRVEEVSGW